MLLEVDGLRVYFPYTYIYPEQYSYMLHLKKLLDAKGAGLLEMPCGTGKTVSLLALITSYQLAHPEVGKLVYCSRTVPEIEKVLEELKRVAAYMQRHVPDPDDSAMLAIGMSSRSKLCVHPVVSQEQNRALLDSMCRTRTAHWVREAAKTDDSIEVCSFYETFREEGANALLTGVYTLEEIKAVGRERNYCPYYFSRHLLKYADVVVYSYQYVLNPKIYDIISADFKSNCIVVFDEAHNIDNVCIESLSVRIGRETLDGAKENLQALEERLGVMRERDKDRLQQEYARLLQGIQRRGVGVHVRKLLGKDNDEREEEEGSAAARQQGAEEGAAAEVLGDLGLPTTDNTLFEKEGIPGSIRKAHHFLHLMKRFVEYLSLQFSTASLRVERPQAFLYRINEDIALGNPHSLRFVSVRLYSLLRTLQISDSYAYGDIILLGSFITLLSSYEKGFALLTFPEGQVSWDGQKRGFKQGMLELACLDASIAMEPVLQKFRSVVITSATLSPLTMYPKMLNFEPKLVERLPMSNSRRLILPLIISKGSDQSSMSTKFKVRDDPGILRNYANMIIELSLVVPDGMIVFFPSYLYMESTITKWNEMGLLARMLQKKLLFIETTNARETSIALRNYREACDSGRGAILLCVARGKVSEGIDFTNHYGRCVIVIGIPYQYTKSPTLLQRLQYMKDNYNINQNEYLKFDAMRQASQCIGRVIRSKSDYSMMVFADTRYNVTNMVTKLPDWISKYIREDYKNLSLDVALSITRAFMREMAQPWNPLLHLGRDLWSEQHIPNAGGVAPMEVDDGTGAAEGTAHSRQRKKAKASDANEN